MYLMRRKRSFNRNAVKHCAYLSLSLSAFIYQCVYMLYQLRWRRCEIIKNSSIFVCNHPSLFLIPRSLCFCVAPQMSHKPYIYSRNASMGMCVCVFFLFFLLPHRVRLQTKSYNERKFNFHRAFNHFCMAQYWRHYQQMEEREYTQVTLTVLCAWIDIRDSVISISIARVLCQ